LHYYLIAKISPNYLSLSARNLADPAQDKTLLASLQQLQSLVSSLGGQTILHQIDDKKSDGLARDTKFDLVEGGYYRAIPFDYLSPNNSEHYD
jgi:hypothetical protein